MNFKDRLSKMQSNWNSSKAQYATQFGGEKVPAGVYIVQLHSAKLAETKESQKLYIRRQHVIMEGDYKGVAVFDNMFIENEMGAMFFRQWIDLCGFEAPDDPTELEELITEISKTSPVAKVNVKHNKDFTNVQYVEVLEDEDVPADVEEPEPAPEPATKPAKKKPAIKKTRAKKEEPVEEPESAESEVETETESEDIKDLIERSMVFCQSFGIEIEPNSDLPDLKKEIKKNEFEEDELVEEELDLLKELGLKACIKAT